MQIPYDSLSRPEQKAAQKLAKKLLRTTPAGVRQPEKFDATLVRTILYNANIKPNAAFTYSDGKGNWFGSVVVRKGKHTHQIDISERIACHSEQEALDVLKTIIAGFKWAKEHPVVAQFRADGFDESSGLLRFGDRFIIVSLEDIEPESKSFLKTHGLDEDAFDIQNAVTYANTIIWQYGSQSPKSISTEVANKMREAASFLLSQGIMDIDEPNGFRPDLHQPFSATMH